MSTLISIEFAQPDAGTIDCPKHGKSVESRRVKAPDGTIKESCWECLSDSLMALLMATDF